MPKNRIYFVESPSREDEATVSAPNPKAAARHVFASRPWAFQDGIVRVTSGHTYRTRFYRSTSMIESVPAVQDATATQYYEALRADNS